MFQKILVVIENERVCRQALDYARELAARMGAEVFLLMLLEMNFPSHGGPGGRRRAIKELEQRAERQLAELGAAFSEAGVRTNFTLQMGDPAQELAKFLALQPPFNVVIWGSDDSLPGGPRRHWMAKAANYLECPLWTVASRSDRGGKS